VFVPFVEHEVQNLLSFDVPCHVGSPDVPCCMFVGLVRIFKCGDNHKLFESVVEVFLVVVEGGVLNFLYLLFVFGKKRVFK